MNILERIDSALNEAQRPKKTPFKEHYPVFREAPREPVIVDMTEQAFRMAALRNSRGPCAGWDDYIAGRDYQPPMYFNSNVPVGPEDTGKHGIMSPQEGDKIQFDGPNPFSRRHANIRPWAPGEMLMTMMTVVDPDGKGNNPADGLLHQVATKGIVKRAAEATHGKYDRYDVDYSMQQGAVAIIQALPGDESRLGTRFTSFVGDYIQQAMKAGLPAGYQDEYRKIRGLRRRVIPLIKSALRNAMDGEPLSTDEQRIRREFATINYCTRCKGTGLVRNPQKAAAPDDEDIPEGIPCPQCDKDASGKSTGRIKEPGPKHPYGFFPPALFEVRDTVLRAITARSAKEIQKALDNAEKVFDEIADKEGISYIPGITTQGQVSAKPREHGSLIAFEKAAKLMQKQRNLANIAIKRIDDGESLEELDGLSDEIWSDFKRIKRDKAWEAPLHDPTKKEPQYHSPYEEKQEDLHNSPGFVGLIELKDRLDRALQSADESALQDFIQMSEGEQQLLRNREEVKVKEIGGTGLTVKGKETGKEQERSNWAGIGQVGDYLKSDANREILGMAIAKVSPFRDDSLERKKHAAEAAKILNSINDAVDEYIASQSEDIDATKVKRDLTDIARDLDASLGEWKEEIAEVLHMVAGTIKIGGGFGDVRREIKELLKVAKQDTKLQQSPDSVPMHQYRMLLRLYGIDNYPERGTPEDPEINEQGGKSRWAEAGYPSVIGVEAGKKANAYLWTDIFETTDEAGRPVQSVSDAYLSRQKKEANLKFKAAADKIRAQIGESIGFDSIEYRLLVEFDQLVCQIIIEDVLPGGMKLIYG